VTPVVVAIAGDDLAGLVIAVLVTGYLLYALLQPEKL
jgi:K+-transporting ATPase KdpF subunit